MKRVTLDYPPFMKTREVAEACGVTPPTVRRWVQLGRLHPSRPGDRDYRFDRDEVAALIARGES